jgi:HAD superfamily hydrolase (TIGR01509 family)
VQSYLALREPLEPASGARELIEQLRARGLKLAVASSSPRVWVEATLAALGLAESFEAIVAGDEVARSKPDPEIFLRAAEKLGVAPAHCLVIEDSPGGVAGAVAAGMRVVAVRSPLTGGRSFAEAALTIDSLADTALLALCVPPLMS